MTGRYLATLSNDAAVALENTLVTHVHKEKPVFISTLGNSLGLEELQSSSVALAVDLLWAVSLMYDDMIDEDVVRSDLPTTWVTFGKEQTMSICHEIVDFILSDLRDSVDPSIALLAQYYVQRGLHSLENHRSLTLSTSIDELCQNYHERNDFNGTFGVHSLLLLSGQQGDIEKHDALLFIRHLNLASQLLNDLKDIDDYYQRGFSDIRNGTVTVPIVALYGLMPVEERVDFLRVFGSKHVLTESEQALIVGLVSKYNVLDETVHRIVDHYNFAEKKAGLVFSAQDLQLVKDWICYKKEILHRYG